MARGNSHPAIRAWRSFRGAGPRTRAFLAARLVVLPLRDMAPELRSLHGRVLSLGSGYGIVERWLAELNPRVEVEGVDTDAERVRVATRTSTPRVRIRELDVRGLEEEHAYDAALAVDVLHHVPRADHDALAAALARALKPGGVLLVKDIADTPRWQARVNHVHDHVVAHEGEVHLRAPEEMAALFARHGFTLERSDRIGRASPYPHYLLRLRAGSGTGR